MIPESVKITNFRENSEPFHSDYPELHHKMFFIIIVFRDSLTNLKSLRARLIDLRIESCSSILKGVLEVSVVKWINHKKRPVNVNIIFFGKAKRVQKDYGCDNCLFLFGEDESNRLIVRGVSKVRD